MDVRIAKEYVHIRDWLALAQEIVDAGEQAYLGSLLAQEAGDSIMMKVGEAAGRLARAGEEPPEGVQWSDAISNRNWVIHQYDEIDRAVTWNTLSGAIPAWRRALAPRIDEAEGVLAKPPQVTRLRYGPSGVSDGTRRCPNSPSHASVVRAS